MAKAQHAPLSGSVIENKASFSFSNLVGSALSGESNTVETVINGVEKVEIFPDNYISERQGRRVALEHTLVNKGNKKATFTIVAGNSGQGTFVFTQFNILVDDIVPAKTETNIPRLTNEAATVIVTLNAGESKKVTVEAQLPYGLKSNDVGSFYVDILNENGKVVSQAYNEVAIIAGTQIELRKTILESEITQGGILTFEINGKNTGDVAALAIPVLIDNVEEHLVLLKDVIPANTQFHSYDFLSSGEALYHIEGYPANEFTRIVPSNPKFVDMIAVGFKEVDVQESFTVRFKVTVNENAVGQIENIATVTYDDGTGTQTTDGVSNLAVAALPDYDAVIHYYTDNTFTIKTNITEVGEPLFLEADAAGCNVHSAWADSTIITITSSLTGDVESFLAIETERNSGIFRINMAIPTRNYLDFPVIQQNQILETTQNDELVAELLNCGRSGATARVIARVYVNPVGVVFDSESNRPIPGALVRILDVTNSSEGVPAQVFDSKGIETLPNEITTEANGEFTFPYLNTGKYRIEIVSPAQYNFPSQLSAAVLPQGRNIETDGSWGREFTISAPNGPARFDIPLDVNGLLAMNMEKEADREWVDLGGFVNYEIKVSNLIQNDITNVLVTDNLPYGFAYIKGSAQLDDSTITDPTGGRGPILEFSIGNLEVGEVKSLTYRLQATSAAISSDGKNVAVATADELIDKISNEADVTVRVDKGVFDDDAYIIGKVFYDKNKNKIQDVGEPGVPNVRIYMENGNYIETDALGKYSFYGVSPKRHVLKLDVTTIPIGGGLEVLDNRHAFDASSRFVDLQKGELHKADFAICDDTQDILPEIRARFTKMTDLPSELALGLKSRMDAQIRRDNRENKALPSSGIVGSKANDVANPTAYKPIIKKVESNSYWKTLSVETTDASLEDLLSIADKELGYLNLNDGDSLNTPITNVMVKGAVGSKFMLFVNGIEIPESRIGIKANSPTVEGWEYVGIELNEGKNEITVQVFDPFGNKRGEEIIHVFAPGLVDHFAITVLNEVIPADGKTVAEIKIEAFDKNGILVKSRTPITLDIEVGQLLTQDLNEIEAGTQQFIEGGVGFAFVEAPLEPGVGKVVVKSGNLKSSSEIHFTPNLRPLIAAGIIEGALRLKNGFRIDAVNQSDVFEEELRGLNAGSDNFSASARTAFFIKGKILGSYLLTASFDSEKEDRSMFRDIKPDEYYPIYGDASVKGFDAQSSGRLFVRVDKNKHFAMYGDFNTMDQSPARNLGQFNRNLTGVKGHYETSKIKANASVSLADSRQVIEELPALGISGPYRLQHENVRENSERIEIITRDRNQPDVIIDSKTMFRFRDYTLEQFTGHIFFNAPVFSLDEDLNPRFIRISYETEETLEKFVVATTDAQAKVTDNIEVGATAHVDLDPADSYNLVSANSSIKLGESGTLVTEVARTDKDSKGEGYGARVEYKHQGNVFNGRVFAGKTSEDFVNPFSMLGGARTEAGMRGTVRLGSKTTLQTEALLSTNDTTGAVRQGAMLNVQRGFAYGLQAELGVRYMKDDQKGSAPSTEQGSVRSKLISRLPFLTSAEVYGEYEQSLASIERRIAALGADYTLGARGRLYARHEFLSSLTGRYSLNDQQQQNNTVVGIDAGYMRNGRVYTEYRSRDAFDGRTTQASMGVRNQFMLREGLGLTAGLERVFSIAGVAVNEGTSISLGLDYTANPNWKASGRIETRFSKQENSYISSLGYAHRLSDQWSFLGKNTMALTKGGSTDRILERLRAGFAYRESEQSRWNALGRYEYIFEQNNGFNDGLERSVHMVSSHINWQPNDPFYLTARWAGKLASETSNNFESQSFLQLLGLRATYDLSRRFDVGASTALLTNESFTSNQLGIGAEVGFIVARNLRLVTGYNFLGYRDQDLASADFTAHGVYVSLHYKFDEQEIFRVTKSKPADYPDLDCGCDVPSFEMPKPVIPSLIATVPTPAILRERFVLPKDVHFGLNKAAISEISATMINRMAWFMHQKDNATINLAGHTDSRNTTSYNYYLSMRRAEAVKAYLIATGVDSTRIILDPKGKTELRIAKETNIVHEAENRRVEFGVNFQGADVDLVTQVEDLQIEKRELAFAKFWNYLLSTELNSVADRVHFKMNNSELSDLNKLLLARIAAILKLKTEVNLVVFGYDKSGETLVTERAKAVITYLEDAGVPAERMQFEFRRSNRYDERQYGASAIHSAIFFSYMPPDDLEILEQNDDLAGEKVGYIPQELYRMVEIQNERNDLPILQSPLRSLPYVANAVHFAFASDKLDHKSQAILMRLVMFLKAHPDAELLLTGGSDSNTSLNRNNEMAWKRTNVVFEFLKSKGIHPGRMLLDVRRDVNAPETTEMDRASNRRVDIEIKNVENVKVIQQTYDIKPRWWR